MLNLAIGSAEQVDGRTCIVTGHQSGHAVYGPYEMLEPGRYVVSFRASLASGERSRQDQVCAVLDVAGATGQVIIASRKLYQSQLEDRSSFTLDFEIAQPTRVEYRVWVSGRVPLRIDEHRRATPVPVDAEDVASLAASDAFPEPDAATPDFFRENAAMFRSLYEQGMRIAFHDDGVVLTVAGVSLHAGCPDDLNFLHEIFGHRVYNIKAGRPLTVIDIGMNIGLTSLMLATKPEVVEIHAFEPFAGTFDRAMDNLRLNPRLARKITAHNAGLSNKSFDGTMMVGGGDDSGSRATIPIAGGEPVHVVLEDAATALAPVIEHARAQGHAIVVKLDCEGSEYPILQSLGDAGLVARIDAFMVEWHAIDPERGQETLLAPLRDAGFLVFDQSPPAGNGFFYAVRMAAADRD